MKSTLKLFMLMYLLLGSTFCDASAKKMRETKISSQASVFDKARSMTHTRVHHTNFHRNATEATAEASGESATAEDADSDGAASEEETFNPETIVLQGWLRFSDQNIEDLTKWPNMPKVSLYPSEESLPVGRISHEEEEALKEEEEEEYQKSLGSKIGTRNQNLEEEEQDVTIDKSSLFRINTHFKKGSPLVPTPTSFYFRLSGLNLYYSEMPSSMTVLGAIAITNTYGTSSSDAGAHCFTVSNSETDSWDICADSEALKKQWSCAIMKLLGQPCGAQAGPTLLKEKDTETQRVIMIPIPAPHCNEKWNYNSHGSDWQCKCKSGLQQSPIDLPLRDGAMDITNQIKIDHVQVESGPDDKPLTVELKDNMLRIEGSFGTVFKSEIIKEDLNGDNIPEFHEIIAEYQAYEMQFHTPSEHTIDGKKYDMEVQIYHRAIDDDHVGQKAVVSYLFEIGYVDEPNSFFKKMDIFDLPNPIFTQKELTDIALDATELLIPDDSTENWRPFSYYMYKGSLTSPQCDEDVIWIIREKPIKAAQAEVKYIAAALTPPPLKAKTSGGFLGDVVNMKQYDNPDGNNREQVELNGRPVYFWNGDACEDPNVPIQPKKVGGHYEVVPQETKKYIYVGSPKPSGLPHSFVVSAAEAQGLDPSQMNKAEQAAMGINPNDPNASVSVNNSLN